MLHIWSTARYAFPLPEGHRFPAEKYGMLQKQVLAEGIVPPERMHEPGRVAREDLLRVHTERYVDAVENGDLTPAEQRLVGLPWSPELAERSYRAAGATCEAALHALTEGVAMSLSGGTHHAFADRGEGFCVFNDVVVATRMLQHRGLIQRAAVIDLDVHQGNGTHALASGDDSVYTFSMHGRNNYPFRKVPGRMDIELEDGVVDDEYLAALAQALPEVLSEAQPDMVFYLAGADTHEGDRLGRMKLTFAGLKRRDVMVLDGCRDIGLPVVVLVAGGYGRDIQDTIRVHTNTAALLRDYGTNAAGEWRTGRRL
ncbi:MAG: histone deacetylase [Gemmatimonadaceae bacterium]